MKTLPLFVALFFLPVYAQNAESDLQNHVIDIEEIQKQEWEEIPTIEEVPIRDVPDESENPERDKSKTRKLNKSQSGK